MDVTAGSVARARARAPARAAVCCALLAAGCTAPRPPLSVEHEDPGIKIPAIKKAARERDRSVIPQLVSELSSDDPAVRFFAIQALEDLTGETFGYRYFEEADVNRAAIEQWKKWLARQPQ